VIHWGTKSIAKRLGYQNEKAVLRLYRQAALPLTKRRHGRHPRQTWCISENLLLAWELATSRTQRQRLLGPPD